MVILPWWVTAAWDWFWYYRRGKIRYHVFNHGDTYNAMASTGTMTVFNCYGSTPEQAKEVASWRLKKALEEEKAPLE